MRYIAFGILLFFFSSVSAQVTFYKQYSGNEYDFGNGVCQLPDSSYVVTGRSGSWGVDAEAFLLKLTKTGTYEWSQHYGSNEFDEGRRVLYNANLGYVVAGSSLLNPLNSYDFYLFNTDLSGNLLWEKRVDLGGWETTNDAVFCADSGVIAVGKSQNASGNGDKGFVVRTNVAGDTLWTKYFGATGENSVNAVLSYQDSLFIIAGTYFNQDSSMTKGFLASIHENGTTNWFVEVGDVGAFGLTDITMNLNRINIVGWHWDPILQKHDNYSGRYELNGTLFYESTFVNQMEVRLDEVTLNGNQTKLYVGYRNENTNDAAFGMDVALGRFNTNFDWDNGPIYINHAGDEKVEQFIPTSDGGALAVGYITYPMNGGNSIFLMKIGPNDEATQVTGNEPMNPLVQVNEMQNEWFHCFPNPFDDLLTVANPFTVQVEVSLVDFCGKVLSSQRLIPGMNSMDFSRLPSGIYFLQCEGTTNPIKLLKH